MPAAMKGQVCVVTGASRGIGCGIALQLCEAGATVYITGRNMDTLKATAVEIVRFFAMQGIQDYLPGTLHVQARGGWCVPVVCVSSQENEVQSLFEQVKWEQHGRLDVLVNNAYAGLQYDRMAADCAMELWPHGVSYVSLWPGLVQTELLKEHVEKEDGTGNNLVTKFEQDVSSMETTEMSGRCVVALAIDPNILSLSGKVLPSCDIARRYGLQDVDGHPVQDYLSVHSALTQVSSLSWLALYFPGFLRMPKWVLIIYASKF